MKRDFVVELLDILLKSKGIFTQKTADVLLDMTERYKAVSVSEDDKQTIVAVLNSLSLDYAIYAYTIVVDCAEDGGFLPELLKYVDAHKEHLTTENKKFLYYSLRDLTFRLNTTMDYTSTRILESLRLDVENGLLGYFTDQLKRIDPMERNRNLAFVITAQLLAVGHSPTNYCLDWCRALKKSGKEVMLIDSSELFIKPEEQMPFDGYIFSYKDYQDYNCLSYKDTDINFFQCPNTLTEKEITQVILDVVTEYKPGYIVGIGDSFVLTVIDRVIPVYTVGLSAQMPRNHTKYRSSYAEITADDAEWLQTNGYDLKSVIKGRFAVTVPEKKEEITREQYGIPESSFVIGVVGNRLSIELDNEMLSLLETCFAVHDCRLIIIGAFETNRLDHFPNLRDHYIHISYANNLIDITTLFDMYFNPRRAGGGTSAIYALSNGIPVVSLNYGDVALNAGNSFTVDTVDDMARRIEQLVSDNEFYSNQCAEAMKRAEVLSDIEGIINKQLLILSSLEYPSC